MGSATDACLFVQLALIIKKIAAGRGSEHNRKLSRLAIKAVLPAVILLPLDGAIADHSRTGVHGVAIIIDVDLPSRTTGRIGARDSCYPALSVSAARGEGSSQPQRTYGARESMPRSTPR